MGFRKKLFLLYLVFPLVLPNSLRSFSIPALCLVGMVAFLLSYKKIGKFPMLIYLVSAVTTVLYVLIGLGRSPSDAVEWHVFVYLISPFLWLCYWTHVLRNFDIESILKWLTVYAVLGCFSVYIFIYLFLNHGADAVRVFIAEANVEMSDGKSGVTMHVLGGLIFMTSAFLAAPSVLGQKSKFLILLFLILTALISGRTALVMAAIIGVIFGFLFSNKRAKILYLSVGMMMFFGLGLILGFFSIVSDDGLGVNIYEILMSAIEKVGEGGGEDRVQQASSLLNGLYDSNFLGVGLGISSEVVRNDVSPWKYELLWLSTLFHVGVLGFAIYLIPVILVVFCFYILYRKKYINNVDVFMISGFLSILIASNTNPYFESFDFQWMIVMPCVYFYNRYNDVKNSSLYD